MTITPQGQLYLCKTKLENDYKNQLTFSDSTAQLTYFNSIIQETFDNYTYIKKDNVVQVGKNIDEIIDCNYLFYKNTGFTNKWYFCFITNMEYVNENCTRITFETDCYQTYMFNIVYNKTFVEREHVNDDTVGLHTIPEGLETGEFTCNAHEVDTNFDNIMTDLVYVISSAINLWIIDAGTNKYKPATPTIYNGIVSGTQYFKFADASDVADKLNDVTAKGQIDAINGLFMAPSNLTALRPNSTTEIASSNSPVSYTNTINKQTTLNGYTPRNKKLLIGDYNYLLVSNNNGNSIVLRYEDFTNSNCTFLIKMCLTAGCSIRMIPTNFKNVSQADEYGINLGKLPICSYPCDMYTNWLTQNSINVMGMQITSDDINLASSVVNTVGSIASKNVGGAIGGVLDIGNSLIAKKQHELIPPQSRGNLNAGDVITAAGKNTFHFYKMSIKQEYARIIDGFFDMFGYKVNVVKIPNITGRTNWNYVKTIECNFDGDIPQTDLNIIKSMFNNGVTLWHNPSTMLDYSQSNNIV